MIRPSGGCDPTADHGVEARSEQDLLAHAVAGVRELQPYQPGKPISELERELGVTDIVKLASNENPLGASPAAVTAMGRELEDLWLYPDGGGYALRQAIGDRHDLDPARVTLGNGSNDVLVLLAETFLAPGREAVFSRYCFAVYPIVTRAAGATARIAEARSAEQSQPLGHDLEAMRALVGPETRVVFIANPNNPTGTWLEAEALEAFIADLPTDVLVVLDEAYHEYGKPLGVPDASCWLDRYPNLVVSRTFSKAYGIAGIRVGYCLSSRGVADLLNRLRQPFNVNSLALVGAQAALGDEDFIERSVRCNSEGLELLCEGLAELGFRCPPSAGNFVLADLGRPAEDYFEGLLRRGVIVRPVGNYGLPCHLRITIGTPEQNLRLLSALGDVHRDVTGRQ